MKEGLIELIFTREVISVIERGGGRGYFKWRVCPARLSDHYDTPSVVPTSVSAAAYRFSVRLNRSGSLSSNCLVSTGLSCGQRRYVCWTRAERGWGGGKKWARTPLPTRVDYSSSLASSESQIESCAERLLVITMPIMIVSSLRRDSRYNERRLIPSSWNYPVVRAPIVCYSSFKLPNTSKDTFPLNKIITGS